jgi:hypothetical protein
MIPVDHTARAGRNRWTSSMLEIGAVVSLAAALFTQEGCKSPEELKKEKEAAAAAARENQAAEQGDGKQTDASSQASLTLRYGFKKGDHFTYQVQIEADLGNATEILGGDIAYGVISADNFEVVIDQTGVLSSRTELHPGREAFMGRMPRQVVSGF